MGTGTWSPNVINFVFLFVNYININVRFVRLRFSRPSRTMTGCTSTPSKLLSMVMMPTSTKAAMTNSPNPNSDPYNLDMTYLSPPLLFIIFIVYKRMNDPLPPKYESIVEPE